MIVENWLVVLTHWSNAYQAGATLAIMAVGWVAHQVLKRYIGRSVKQPEVRQGYWGLSRNLTFLLSAALVAAVWIEELKTVSLLLTGLLAATLIVNKEVFLGMVARLTLSVVKQYDIGDRIRINGVGGDVIDVGLLHTWLMEVAFEDDVETQSTGRVIVIPHLWLATYAVINLTHGHDFFWDEIELAFPPDTDAQGVMSLMVSLAEQKLGPEMEDAQHAVRRMADRYASRNPPVTPVAYSRVCQYLSGQQALLVALRYAVRVRRRREVHSTLLLSILSVLRSRGVYLIGGRNWEAAQAPGQQDQEG
jgi:hypothetical protein